MGKPDDDYTPTPEQIEAAEKIVVPLDWTPEQLAAMRQQMTDQLKEGAEMDRIGERLDRYILPPRIEQTEPKPAETPELESVVAEAVAETVTAIAEAEAARVRAEEAQVEEVRAVAEAAEAAREAEAEAAREAEAEAAREAEAEAEGAEIDGFKPARKLKAKAKQAAAIDKIREVYGEKYPDCKVGEKARLPESIPTSTVRQKLKAEGQTFSRDTLNRAMDRRPDTK